MSKSRIRIDIYPLPGVELSGEYKIADHVNLSGSAPRLGFNPLTDLYSYKHDKNAIIVACLKAKIKPTEEEAAVLKANGVKAYTYSLLEPALFAAANNQKLEAIGFVPSLPKGISLYSAAAGIKVNSSTLDLAIAVSEVEALWAGVFTINKARAICVDNNAKLLQSKIRGLIANSGNANACTGIQGERDDQAIREAVATKFGVKANQVLTASTGKIGVTLPLNKITNAVSALNKTSEIIEFAEAMLTTDLVIKVHQDSNFNILGFAKGSGMIQPNMATMFGFLFSDVKIKGMDESQMQQAFQDSLKEIADKTFNAISVDGDTSTNDMVIFISTCLGKEISLEEFKVSLEDVCVNLAKKVVLDGEGTTKLIELNLYGIKDQSLAYKIGKKIINSLLVKTAIFGLDPNWGRIIASLGQACAELDYSIDLSQSKLNLLGCTVYQNSLPTEFDRTAMSDLMKKNKVIKLDLFTNTAIDNSGITVWGSDLSYDYVRINAEYFT